MSAARLALLLALALSWPAAAADVFAHPATPERAARDLAPAVTRLQGARTLRGLYTQRKQLTGVPRPLEAEGDFLFVRGTGMAWRTLKPFESELVITPGRILQREGGRVSMQLSADRQPAVRVVSAVFEAVFALDFDALAARFELFSRAGADGWELGLRPRSGQATGLREVLVAGGANVERVQVTDAAGDHTDVRLRETTVSTELPPAGELARFPAP